MDKKKIKKYSLSSVLAIVGFILSPLSWWNDLLVNVPLAFVLTLPIVKFISFFTSPVSQTVFFSIFVFNYWLTNVIGLFMIHAGIVTSKDGTKTNWKKEIGMSIIWSVVYTGIVIAIAQVTDVKSVLEGYILK